MTNPLNFIDSDDDMQRMLLRKAEATAGGGHAYQRLLQITETGDSGQVRRIAYFLAATYNAEAFALDLFELSGRRCNQRRHAFVHRLLALGSGRPIPLGARRRAAREGGDRKVGPEMARVAVTRGGCVGV